MASFSVTESDGILVGTISLNTTGQLEQAVSVVVQTLNTGAATGDNLCVHDNCFVVITIHITETIISSKSILFSSV